jgi:hypothetical protein
MVMIHGSGEDERRAVDSGIPTPAANLRRCRCGATHHCDQVLDAIRIPEEDSRLYARACIDFGQVPLGEAFSAAIASNFNIRIHVPRALQQQITGNGFVGSVLGSARISADISERVGMVPSQCGDTDVCLFVGFHQERRGTWLADLRVLRGSRLRVPVRIDAAIAAQLDMLLPTGIAPMAVQFDADVTASCGPIAIPSGSVSDLWRSVRDQVRNLLAQHLESAAKSELVRLRAALRASLRSEPSAGTPERNCRVAWSTG